MWKPIRPVVPCVALLTFGAVASQARDGERAQKHPVVIAAAVSADQASTYIRGMNFGPSRMSF